ncbi:MAG: hypothetical protein OHK0048_07540 [Rhodoferax sp.]
MNFRGYGSDEPEINLIPFIDVLLVILIFLMLSTTYSRLTELQITLPTADVAAQRPREREIQITINAEGDYRVNDQPVGGRSVDTLAEVLSRAARASAGASSMVILQADASARHQSVVTVMEAAQRAGLANLTFATQTSKP